MGSAWSQFPGGGTVTPGAPQHTCPQSVGMVAVAVEKSGGMPPSGVVVAMIQRTPTPLSPTSPGTSSASPRYIPVQPKNPRIESATILWPPDVISISTYWIALLPPPSALISAMRATWNNAHAGVEASKLPSKTIPTTRQNIETLAANTPRTRPIARPR